MHASAVSHPPPRGETVHGRYDGRAQALDQIHYRLPIARLLLRFDGRVCRDLVDVGAGDECFVSGPGNDCAADFRIVFSVLKCLTQIGECSSIQGIQDLGTIHCDVSETVLLLV